MNCCVSGICLYIFSHKPLIKFRHCQAVTILIYETLTSHREFNAESEKVQRIPLFQTISKISAFYANIFRFQDAILNQGKWTVYLQKYSHYLLSIKSNGILLRFFSENIYRRYTVRFDFKMLRFGSFAPSL